MRKIIVTLIVLSLAVSGLVFSSRAVKKENPKKASSKRLTTAEMRAGRKKWESTPDGVAFKKWEASPIGQKVLAAIAKINTPIQDATNMEAEITSLSLPEGSRLGFGVMVRIADEDYILSFGALKSTEFQELLSLKETDKIILRGHGVSYAPKYAYPILAADLVQRDGKMIFKRVPSKGC